MITGSLTAQVTDTINFSADVNWGKVQTTNFAGTQSTGILMPTGATAAVLDPASGAVIAPAGVAPGGYNPYIVSNPALVNSLQNQFCAGLNAGDLRAGTQRHFAACDAVHRQGLDRAGTDLHGRHHDTSSGSPSDSTASSANPPGPGTAISSTARRSASSSCRTTSAPTPWMRRSTPYRGRTGRNAARPTRPRTACRSPSTAAGLCRRPIQATSTRCCRGAYRSIRWGPRRFRRTP